jgi:uncharacterized protein YndB with AHSA1/START domain
VSATPQSGTLVLADLTGYTAYLSRGEIQHAPVIAGDLLETIVGRLEPPFRLAKLEGDAAFLYVEDGRADGSLQLDAIEAAYYAFRRRLRSIDSATTCDCNACSLAPRLDLKLFVHHGTFVRSRIAGRDELAGADVILAHRLLKGAVAADRTAGFAQFTAAAADALGIEPAAPEMTTAFETFEHIGSTETVVLDLDARWEWESNRRLMRIDPTEAIVDLEVDLRADPADVWAHLTSPNLRPLWEGPIRIEETTAGSRRGIGTTARCVTGHLATLEEIVDWQPYDHLAWRLVVPDLGPVSATADLDPVADRTRLHVRWAGGSTPDLDPGAVERARQDRRAAIDRLAGLFERRVETVQTSP